MHKSPIDIIYHEVYPDIDSEICKAVLACKIAVDKQELIKALAYDRQQYEKGYADAIQAAIEAIDNYYNEKKYITRSRTILSAICADMKSVLKELPS